MPLIISSQPKTARTQRELAKGPVFQVQRSLMKELGATEAKSMIVEEVRKSPMQERTFSGRILSEID